MKQDNIIKIYACETCASVIEYGFDEGASDEENEASLLAVEHLQRSNDATLYNSNNSEIEFHWACCEMCGALPGERFVIDLVPNKVY